MTERRPRIRKIDIFLLAIIFIVGIFLRIAPQAFSSGASLHSVAPFHPRPAFDQIGFDENLYRQYVNHLAKIGWHVNRRQQTAGARDAIAARGLIIFNKDSQPFNVHHLAQPRDQRIGTRC